MNKGERIKNLRERIGKNQTEFADIIGVSKQTLYKYENNIITNIPSDKIEAIADATNSDPSYIMGWEYSKNDLKRIEKLTADDIEIIEAYKSLPQESKAIIKAFLGVSK